MIFHYLKVAIRNLLSHKTQTLVSLFGLAMAFACVSLASFWNHYERTYDAFQENADRIYRVRETSDKSIGSFGGMTPERLYLYLKEKYPEVEASCLINPQNPSKSQDNMMYTEIGFKASINGKTHPRKVYRHGLSPEALDMFGFEWLKGDKNVAGYQGNVVAISEELAQSLCGNQSPLGQTLELLDDKWEVKSEVVGVFKSRSQHSNLKFDVIQRFYPHYFDGWGPYGAQTYVMLYPGVNHKQFIQKLHSDTIKATHQSMVFDVIPLTKLHYTYPDEVTNVSLEDVNLFATAAVLLTLCALLNYLTLFVSRLRARGRDMALRTICGSSGWQMSGLLMTEYLLLLLAASLLGMLFVEWVMQKFMELAMIQIEFSSVMISCGCLMLFSMVLSVLLSAVPILYFKRKTLRVQIEATSIPLGKNHFRSIGVCIQLVIGFLFIFCTVVMMKQIYMLTNVDNIERKQVAWVTTGNPTETDLIQNVLQQQPFIKEVLAVSPLYPSYHMTNNTVSDWDGKSADSKEISLATYGLNDEISQFYGLKMKEGAASFELGKGEMFINETLAKKMDMDSPIGKSITLNGRARKVKGVIYDFQVQNPRTEPTPIAYFRYSPPRMEMNGITKIMIFHVAFKYDGDWETCKKKLTAALLEKGLKNLDFADGEEHYQSFLQSEYNLLKLLTVITIVSILIAIFGIYALIMQSCDQHQKEIAVRKVFGAKVVDILLMFFKQYMIQMVVAAAIAFPIGYFLMKNWLQQYARQTEISFWIYLAIFVGISLLVTLCIGWRVWRAANENPAAVIKKE